jgi:hypothetical protein
MQAYSGEKPDFERDREVEGLGRSLFRSFAFLCQICRWQSSS